MGTTNIEWTQQTWNPTVGCDQISPGCAHCYAKTLHDKRHQAFTAGKLMPLQYAQPFESLQMMADRLDVPLRRKVPTTYFVNSVSDLFHEHVSDAFIDRVFAAMAMAPEHTFQILTKRAERMRAYMDNAERHAAIVAAMDMPAWMPAGRRFLRVPENWPMPNVWLGVSVENQPMYDKRIGGILRTPAAVRFLSVEPMLGPVDLRMGGMSVPEYSAHDPLPPIDWVIVGGESGPGARSFDIAWARSIVSQCQVAKVPMFVKQLGTQFAQGRASWSTAKRRDRKGGDMSEWPEDLRVRELPSVNRL